MQHRSKTKATNFIKHRRETSLLYILSCKCLKSFDFIILLQLITILLCKASLHAGGRDLQVLGFINPVLESGYEDDGILEPQRSFSGVFETFVNQWYVKTDENIVNIALDFMLSRSS